MPSNRGAEKDYKPTGAVTIACRVEDVSDGYHTFSELYDHRNILFANVVLAHHDKAFKTWKNQNGESSPGWFILGVNTVYGQISYHLPERYWDIVNVRVIQHNADYDGHSSDDVALRLLKMVTDGGRDA